MENGTLLVSTTKLRNKTPVSARPKPRLTAGLFYGGTREIGDPESPTVLANTP